MSLEDKNRIFIRCSKLLIVIIIPLWLMHWSPALSAPVAFFYCLLGGETSHQNIVMRGIFSCFNTSSTVKCRRGDCVATLELNTRAGNIIWISYLLGSDTTQYSGQSQILTLYSGVVWDKKENKKILFLFLAQLSSPPQHQ